MSDAIQLSLSAPVSWQDCSNSDLEFIFSTIAQNKIELSHIAVLFLFRSSGVLAFGECADGFLVKQNRCLFMVSAEELAPALSQLEWLHDIPTVPVRFVPRNFYRPRDPFLSDISFEEFLALDCSHQGYLKTQDDIHLLRMAEALYQSSWPVWHVPSPTLRIAALYWFASFKRWATDRWPNLFRPDGQQDRSFRSHGSLVRDAVDTMIRALTKGDVAKERQILESPCHRALTELDALARESEEFRRSRK